MILIHFADERSEKRGLGCLAGRFPAKILAHGGTMVPAEALSFLAAEGVEFTVKGHADYFRDHAPLRDLAAA